MHIYHRHHHPLHNRHRHRHRHHNHHHHHCCHLRRHMIGSTVIHHIHHLTSAGLIGWCPRQRSLLLLESCDDPQWSSGLHHSYLRCICFFSMLRMWLGSSRGFDVLLSSRSLQVLRSPSGVHRHQQHIFKSTQTFVAEWVGRWTKVQRPAKAGFESPHRQFTGLATRDTAHTR